MSRDELTLFSYEVLGLVGSTGAGAHDLLRMAQRGRILDWAGESQYYVEPKRLAQLGYLDARREPGKTRQRTVYTLTDKGLDALRRYARTPVAFTPLKSEALLRLLIADLVGEAATRHSVLTLRSDIDDLLHRLAETEASAEALPHRRKYLLLVTSFLRRLLELHLTWIDEVEHELSPPGRHRTEGRLAGVEIDWHDGPRAELRQLFELAEDSESQLDQYVELGRVLVAARGPVVLGHLQLVPATHPGEIELKNMAVVPEQRGAGVGRALIRSATLRCEAEGWSRMVVATAAADVGNLRFYQRSGFRLLSVERDAFTAATGYPQPIVIDGIALLDRVWLARDLAPR